MTKMRVITMVLVLSILWPAALTAHAQGGGDGGQDGCDIELEAAILALVQAQRTADTGNTFGAVQTLDDVQAQLAALVEACEGVLFPLPQTYTAPDESIAFDYPEGWAMMVPGPGLYLLGTSQQVLNTLSDEGPGGLSPGEQLLLMYPIIELEEYWDGTATFEELLADVSTELLEGLFGQSAPPQTLEIQERTAQRFIIRDEDYESVVDLVDYLDADVPALMLLAAFTVPGEMDLMEPILEAVEARVRYPAAQQLRELGVPLADLSYAAVTDVRDLVEDIDLYTITLAPDGSAIAWYSRENDQELCLYHLAAQTVTCDPLPDTFRGPPPVLHWSPDGRYIAFTTNFFRTFYEADILLYDVAGRQVINRTDDGINQWTLLRGPEEESPGPLWLDAFISWGPDGYLYFWRGNVADPNVDNVTDTMRSQLYRVAPDEGEPELIRDLTDDFGLFPLYYSQFYSLDGAMSVSPDAKQIALIVREQKLDAPNNGIWVIDLSGDHAPRQLATYAMLQVGLPSDEDTSEIPIMPSAVTWDAEGTGLYVLADNAGMTALAYTLAYHIDVESGAVTPLIDLSGYTRQDLYNIDADTGHSPVFQMARAAVLAPDASALLILNLDPQGIGLSALRLADGAGKQELLYTLDDARLAPSYAATVARDGTVLFSIYLFTPSR